MHQFIGRGAVARNSANIRLFVLRLDHPKCEGFSEAPNPKWVDHKGYPGAINVLSPPPWKAEDGEPQFDRGGSCGEPATSAWSGPVAATVSPRVTNTNHCWPREHLERRSERASRLWAAGVAYEKDAISDVRYRQPSQAATARAWKDIRTQGKIRCSSGETDIQRKVNNAERMLYRERKNWAPALNEVTEWQWAARYGFSFPSLKYPDRQSALKAFATWRRRMGFPDSTSGAAPHGLRWSARVVEAWECKRRRKIAYPDFNVRIKGGKPRHLAPSAEHAGNTVVQWCYPYSEVPCRCTNDEAIAASKQRDKLKIPPRKRPKVDWNELARCAKAGDSNAYNQILVAAQPIVEQLERKYSAQSSHDLIGDLGHAGLYGFANEETGKLESGIWYAITQWDERKLGGFKSFVYNAIKWGMIAYIKTLPDRISLNRPLSDDDGDNFIDFVTADNAYGANDYGEEGSYWKRRAVLKAELDKRMAGLTERQRQVITHRRGLNGSSIVPTLEELGGDMGISRETARQAEIAAEQKIGIRG